MSAQVSLLSSSSSWVRGCFFVLVCVCVCVCVDTLKSVCVCVCFVLRGVVLPCSCLTVVLLYPLLFFFFLDFGAWRAPPRTVSCCPSSCLVGSPVLLLEDLCVILAMRFFATFARPAISRVLFISLLTCRRHRVRILQGCVGCSYCPASAGAVHHG